MSFANQYIQKYGEKAVQIYKKSLRHSDVHDQSGSPKHLIPKISHLKKESSGDKKLKKDGSKGKLTRNHSKSMKSIKSHKSPVESTQVQSGRQRNSKSILEQNHQSHKNQSRKPSNHNGFTHTFSNIHLNLGHLVHPSKKKLIISEINTPKCITPSKNQNTVNVKRGDGVGINTNVNVYVNAYNRSKDNQKQAQKSKKTLQHSKSRAKQMIASKKRYLTDVDTVKNLISMIQHQQSQSDRKFLYILKDKLQKLKQKIEKRQYKYKNLSQKIKAMQQIMKKESLSSTNYHTRSIHHQESPVKPMRSNSKQSSCNRNQSSQKLKQRIHSMQEQLSKYKDKEATLLKIIDNLGQLNKLNQQQQKYAGNSSSEDEDDL